MKYTDDEECSVKKIGGGSSSNVYLLGNGRVLKVYNSEHYKKAEIEYKKNILISNLGIPVPKTYGLTFTAKGEPAIEMEYIPGVSLSEYIHKHPYKYPFILYKMARLSAKIGSISFDYPDADTDFALKHLDKNLWISFYINKVDQIQIISQEEISRIKRFLGSIPESRCFLHADYDPSNFIINDRDGQIRLIDFGESGFGPWLFELWRMYSMYYDPDLRRGGKLWNWMTRQVFCYYLWIYLRLSKRSKNINTAIVLCALGALNNIKRLIIKLNNSETDTSAVRSYVDRALKCIDSLPGGLFLSERG